MCVLSLVLLSTGAPAQERVIINGPAPDAIQFPGMPGRQLKTGTARIRGRVLSGDTGSPVRRAQIRVSGQEIMPKTAMTDAEGRYEFRDLPGGRFTLSATKSGFVTMQYGQTRPFESGKTIEIVDTQVLEKADIMMPRGSVIAGRILDEFGDPVADAMVSAMRSSWAGGRRRLLSSGRTAQTNDLGQYRIYGLPPGDYYISATLRNLDAMMGIEMAMAMSTAGGAAPPAGPTGSNNAAGYAPTYFPGTISGSQAQKVTIAVGQEAQGTDFALLPVRLAKITGTVIGSDGRPADGSMVNAVPRNNDGGGMPLMMAGAGRTDKNGNFTLTGLAPGDYTLQTRAMQITTSGGADMMTFSVTTRMGGPDGSEPEFGSVPVSVAGDDISNVIVLTSKGTTATGTLTFEGGARPPAAAALRVMASPIDNDGPMLMGPGGGATVKPDGSFELKGLAGARMIRTAGLPTGWMLRSVRVNGADITDTGMDFKPGEAVTGLEVVLTSKLTEVSGTVKGSGSEPAKDYTLIVFSDDPQRWTVPMTRYVTGVRPDQQGRFQVRNLPAGGYYAIAVDYMPQGEWGDPEVLQRIKDKASKFSLDEGERKSLDLKLVVQ